MRFNLIIICFIIFSCNTSTKKIAKFETIKGIGTTKTGTYTFCSIIPKTINYTYRTGHWVFITNDSITIAEGSYDVVLKEETENGGCAYNYYISKADISKWRFWDSNKKPIKPNKRLINYINP